jgi:hypothetical protein
MLDIEGLADQLFAAFEGYVERRCSALTKRCEDLERQLLALPTPKNGKDADEDAIVKRVLEAIQMPKDGAVGPAGPAGADGEKGEKGEKGEPGAPGRDADEGAIIERVLAAIPIPKDGKDGERGEQGPTGKDADEEAIVARVLAAIPVPKDGKDGLHGKDADENAIVERVLASIPKPKDGERGPAGKDGKDGESVHPDTFALAVREAVDAAVEKRMTDIRVPKDGAPGRDALDIDILEHVDEQRSYPIGTFAKYRGGLIKATKHTEPLEQGFDKSGWTVIVDGVDEVSADWLDERTCEVRIAKSSGAATVLRKEWPLPFDCGVYKPDREYKAGDGVTWGGSFWICQAATMDKPGTSPAWRLAVRAGRDAR